MAETIDKKVIVFGKEISLTIPSRKGIISSMDDYFDSFDIGANLVLHVSIKPQENFPSNHIVTGISTKDGFQVSRYESGLVHDEKLFDSFNAEIEGTLANIQRDANAAYENSAKLTDAFSDVVKNIENEVDRNTPSGGHVI